MQIREYQAWLEQWDRSRTWEQVTLGHTLMHAMEELGEVSKIVQMIEGYRPPKPADPAALRDELALELSDLQVMLFKLAYLCGIDMEEAMVRGQHKADARFPDPASGPQIRRPTAPAIGPICAAPVWTFPQRTIDFPEQTCFSLLTSHKCSCIVWDSWEKQTFFWDIEGLNMSSLSDRQRRILGFIMDFTEVHDYPPTIREIGEQVGITSTSVVNYNLAKLEDMNLLTRQREVSRGLSLNRPKLADMGITGAGNNGTLKLGALRGTRDEVVDGRRLRVPILGKIAAGNPIQVEAIDPAAAEDWIELAEGLLGANQQLFALRVQGDSMIDASVLDGDIVILRHQNTADDGDMVAAWIDGDDETTLKFLYREGRNVRLQPANPNPQFKPIIRPAEKVRINGKVVSVIRLLH